MKLIIILIAIAGLTAGLNTSVYAGGWGGDVLSGVISGVISGTMARGGQQQRQPQRTVVVPDHTTRVGRTTRVVHDGARTTSVKPSASASTASSQSAGGKVTGE